MKLLPAIDLHQGEAVRLYKGDYTKKTVYSSHPEEVAKYFELLGAKYLHIVDLDGAKDAKAVNKEVILKIRKETSLNIEVGGGIRDEDTISYYLDEIGINHVILGTIATQNLLFVREMIKKYGSDKIYVGVDIKDGYVQTSGWLENSSYDYLTFIKKLEECGVSTIICTDISKDGTLQGPSFQLYEDIRKHSSINIIVSGGVKDREDVFKAFSDNYEGCIIGKAYYENHIDLKEVIQCLQKESSHV